MVSETWMSSLICKIKKIVRPSIFFFLGISAAFSLWAQESRDIDKWMDMDLDQLSKVKLVSVSVGKKNVTIREAPGIISLITSEEIRNSGARDLIDVLRLVPGFDFNVDVEGAIGIGVRGNWAYEGKAMLLLDGQEMNERQYAIIPFGAHFPIDQIDRVEIIRGPGSSVYGEFAELAVINIITKNNPGSEGITLSSTYGSMSDTEARKNINVMIGKKIKDFNMNLGVYAGDAKRSRLDYTDIYGDSYSMKDNSKIEAMSLNLNLQYKNLSTRFIMDKYRYMMRAGYDQVYELPMKYTFNSYSLETKYETHVGKAFKLVPRINVSSFYPWNSTDENSQLLDHFYKVRVDRLKLSLQFSGDVTDNIFLSGGVMQNFDRGSILGDTPEDSYFDGEKRVHFSNRAAFFQAFVKTPVIIITTGLRYDHHNRYGDSMVPWVGLNKVYKKFYFKFLFGQTFRAPNIANITLSDSIKPEKSTEFDMEIGYELSGSMIFSVNLFSTKIKDPIVFMVDPETQEESYTNFGKTGTWGIEAEWLCKGEWGYINTNYSFYRAKKNGLDLVKVEGNPNLNLGSPAHKITLNSSFNITKKFSVNPSLVYYSKRFGYMSVDENEELVLESFKPATLVNLFILYKNVIKNLDAGFGVYDVTRENFRFLQPYKGYHAPLPATTREILLNIRYHIQ